MAPDPVGDTGTDADRPAKPYLRAVRTPPDPTNGTDTDRELAAAETAAKVKLAQARAELPLRNGDVFACYLGDIALRLNPTTEADPIGVMASLLGPVGVAIGPGPHLRIGDDLHPLVVWPLLVGRTGIGKKGTAWATARRVITAAAPEFAACNIHSGLTSGEGLAAVFAEDDPDDQPRKPNRTARPARLLPTDDTRLLDFEPEWAGVMARMRRDGNSLSATLRAAWEGGNLSTLTVTARVARQSHIGVMAHITPQEFADKVSLSDMAGGTYNRFLPVFVACSKLLPGGSVAPDELVTELGTDLAARLDKAAGLGLLGFAADGERAWRRLYLELGTHFGDDGPVEQFTSRAGPNCLRVAAIYAALDGTDAITADHLTAAAALIRYSTASARAVFTNNTDQTRLLAFIIDAGAIGRTKTEITKELFKNKPPTDLPVLLDRLLTSGRIAITERPRADGRTGRHAQVFTTTDPANFSNFRS